MQEQVSGVIDVMKTNIGKVMQRGEKLEDLEEKSGEGHSGMNGLECHSGMNGLEYLRKSV